MQKWRRMEAEVEKMLPEVEDSRNLKSKRKSRRGNADCSEIKECR
jgi:hypothetical protein